MRDGGERSHLTSEAKKGEDKDVLKEGERGGGKTCEDQEKIQI